MNHATRRVRNDPHHPFNRPQPTPEKIYGCEVGIITGVMHHNGKGSMPSEQAWARSVPGWARVPGRVK